MSITIDKKIIGKIKKNLRYKKKCGDEMRKNPKVAILILNCNGKDLLKKCLDSIEKNTTYPNYKIIVIDNGSIDGSAEMVKEEYPYVHVIRNRENLGFSRANNQGIKYVIGETDYVLLLNNDTEIFQKNWLKTLIDNAERDKKTGIICGKLLYPDRSFQQSAYYRIGLLEWEPVTEPPDEVIEVDGAAYCGVMIKKKVIEKIGLLDEGFSPFCYEEFDHCIRAQKAGYKIIYCPHVEIIHYGGLTITKKEEDFKFFINRKSKIRFMFLNFPLSWLVCGVLLDFFSLFLQRKTPGTRLALTNITLRRGFTVKKFGLFLKAWAINLKNLREILEKRRNRTAKIWYC